jgi:hypothetical protein
MIHSHHTTGFQLTLLRSVTDGADGTDFGKGQTAASKICISHLGQKWHQRPLTSECFET